METRKVRANFPNRPKGAEMEVPGLGMLINGESVDVDKDRYDAYKEANPEWSGSFPHTPEPLTEGQELATGGGTPVEDSTGTSAKGGSK